MLARFSSAAASASSDATFLRNAAFDNGTHGFRVVGISEKNTLKENEALGNGILDAKDDVLGSNTWVDNVFDTSDI